MYIIHHTENTDNLFNSIMLLEEMSQKLRTRQIGYENTKKSLINALIKQLGLIEGDYDLILDGDKMMILEKKEIL